VDAVTGIPELELVTMSEKGKGKRGAIGLVSGDFDVGERNQ